MNAALAFVTLAGITLAVSGKPVYATSTRYTRYKLAIVSMIWIFSLLNWFSGQQSEKGNSIIPFPRVGRSNGGMSPGLIPFPRIGRDGSGKQIKFQQYH